MGARAISSVALLALLLGCARPQEAIDSPVDAGLFVDVQIPEPLTPLERGEKYETPLNETLARLHLGEITGGGTQLGHAKPDGTHDIQYVVLDINLSDAGGLPVLRAELKRLGAPRGTTLHYEAEGKRIAEPLWQ